MKIKFTKITALIMIIVLLSLSALSGCSSKSDSSGGSSALTGDSDAELTAEQQEFADYLENMFLNEVVSDTVTLHYTILNPSDFGIDDYDITLGEYSADAFEKSYAEISECLDDLAGFDYDALTYSQQLTYDILTEYFETALLSSDLYLYSETLSPTVGVQAELPIVLAEYTLNTEQDVKDYLELLKCVKDYYEQIIDFEKLKADNGLFMADFAADDIISQCESFIEDDIDDNCLITSFDERIADVEGLSDDAANSYIAENRTIVEEYVVPAYEALIDGLEGLKGSGVNEGGLAGYEDGAEYYEYLVKSVTGSSRSVSEIKTMIEEELSSSLLTIYALLQNDSSLYTSMYDYSFDLTEPEDILNDLISKISDDFPTPVTTDYTVKYVPESLQDDLSPAFYLTAPIDDLDNNVIYINNNPDYSGEDLYTTLAHEGFPGHLYQTTYFSSTNPDHIRELLSFGGYTEGWATYVELYAYGISGLDENLAKALQCNTSFALAIYSLIDIGINYEGWTLDDTAEFLETYYVMDDDTTYEIYKCMVEEPANYLQYYVGYLEFNNLLSKAQESLGSKFVLKDFHEFLLTTGPAQFDIIDKYMNEWVAEQ